MKKVLVFDDDRFSRDALRDALADAAFDAETVGDAEAFDKALTWWKPDLVVVELNLPGKGGLDIVRSIRERHGSLRVVLKSAMVEDSLARLAREVGADACFSSLQGYRGIVRCVRDVGARGNTSTFDPGVDW